jgi:hypothetical protein
LHVGSAADGGEIALVEQGQLQAAGLCEAADRWRRTSSIRASVIMPRGGNGGY